MSTENITMITEHDLIAIEAIKKFIDKQIRLRKGDKSVDWEKVRWIESLDRVVNNLQVANQFYKPCSEEDIKERFYTAECSQCGWWGSSKLLIGGGAIADTGDYSDCCCPVCESPEINDKSEEPSNNIKPKKLIRSEITKQLKEGEWEVINDINELNALYALKVREELAEIQASEHKDIYEFVDLIQVAYQFGLENGFSVDELTSHIEQKSVNKGTFGRLALNNLNPDNPSNKLYFEQTSNPT